MILYKFYLSPSAYHHYHRFILLSGEKNPESQYYHCHFGLPWMKVLSSDISKGIKCTYLKRYAIVWPQHEQFKLKGVPYIYKIYLQKIYNNMTHYQLLEVWESKAKCQDRIFFFCFHFINGMSKESNTALSDVSLCASLCLETFQTNWCFTLHSKRKSFK